MQCFVGRQPFAEGDMVKTATVSSFSKDRMTLEIVKEGYTCCQTEHKRMIYVGFVMKTILMNYVSRKTLKDICVVYQSKTSQQMHPIKQQ